MSRVRMPRGSNPATKRVRLGSAAARRAFSRSRTLASFLANSTRRRRRMRPHSRLQVGGGREAGEQRRAGAGNLRWRAVVGQGTGAVAVSSTAVAGTVQAGLAPVATPGG